MITALGDWIAPHPWSHFVHLTFNGMVTPEGAKKLFERYVLEQGEEVIFFRAIEWNRFGDVPHIHALIGNTKELKNWYHGIAKVEPYNAGLGARYYICKHITSEYVDWDLNF
ncbi:MAG TPA: hypothetical protein DCL35_07255 [Candidatus Omnitrophica bacterium]|nr:hypothetical protein [Candidatus Omnitrophota bacterium]